ncbi:hypothetical protein GCM10009860_21900 [Microbacterium mitrae]
MRASVAEEYGASLDAMKEHASSMFPVLTFHPSAWSRANSLRGSADEVVPGLMQHLGALNDEVLEIWASETETTARQSALGSLGIAASPENSNTRRNAAAMAERTFQFGDQSVRCEWHTKLRPNINRIHFAVGQKAVEIGGEQRTVDTVFIGIITDHLGT